jgi:histone H3
MARTKQTARSGNHGRIGAKSLGPLKIKMPTGSHKRKWRLHPGTKALREIRRYQKTTDHLLKKQPVNRLIRETIQSFNEGFRLEKRASNAVHEALETFLVSYFRQTNVIAVAANKKTVLPRHWKYLYDIHRIVNPESILSQMSSADADNVESGCTVR